MREELVQRIMNILISHGITDMSIKDDLTILLNDYEIAERETAIAIRGEDKNRYYLEKFIIAKTVKGCTKRTLENYFHEIKRILEAIGKPADEITADDIRLYLALRDRRDKVSKTSQDNELRYLRSFYGYLQSEELIAKNPTAKIDKIKCEKQKRKAFTELEVEQIRNVCANSKEKAIVEVLLSTGCRVSELLNIKIGDIKNTETIVHGKGNKDRIVYLNAKAQLAVQKYLSDRKDCNPYLFPRMIQVTEMKRGKYRNAYMYPQNIEPDGHMNESSVENLIRRLAKKAGVEDAYPHKFRRTCATFALRRGMPIEQVSKMLGHEQIGTTQIYLDLDEKDLELAHRKYVI